MASRKVYGFKLPLQKENLAAWLPQGYYKSYAAELAKRSQNFAASRSSCDLDKTLP